MKNTDAWLIPQNYNQWQVLHMNKSIRLLHSNEAAGTWYYLSKIPVANLEAKFIWRSVEVALEIGF